MISRYFKINKGIYGFIFIVVVLIVIVIVIQYVGVKQEKQALGNKTAALETVRMLNKKAKSLRLKDPVQTNIYAHKALKIAQKNNYILEEAESFEHLGFAYVRTNEITKGINYYKQALDIFEAKQLSKKIGATLYQISRAYYFQGKYKQAKEFYLKGMEVSKRSKDSAMIGDLSNILGLIYGSENKSNQAIAEYKKALGLKKRFKDTIGIGNVYNNMGIEYYNQGDHDKAIKFYEKAWEKIYNKSKDTTFIVDLLNNIGALNYRQGQYKQAIRCFKKVLTYYQANDTKERAYPFTNIGATYLRLKKYKKSLYYLEKALMLEKKANNTNGIVTILYDIGLAYASQEEYDQALIKYKEALKMCKRDEHQRNRAAILIEVGDIFRIQARYQAASDTLQVALNINKKLQAKSAIARNYEALADLDAAQGNFKRGWEFYKKFIGVNTTLFSEKKNKQLLEVQTRYETQKKEHTIRIKNKQIALLKKQKEHEQLLKHRFIESLVSIGVVGLLIIILLYSRVKSKKRLIEYNKHLHEIESKNLQRELGLKQQQLTSKALHIVQKNSMLEKIQTNLQQIPDHKASSNEELMKLSRMVNSSLKADREWDDFFNFFSEVHQDFFNQLKTKSKKLSNSELRLCALIKLKFTSKEISSILGITYGSISVARHRVRKKLAIPKEQKLSDFLSDL